MADYKQRVKEVIQRSTGANKGVAVNVGNHQILTDIYSGQKMFVDERDISESPHIIVDGHWEIDITRVFEKLVEPGGVVFDIGCTYGYFALIAGHKGAGRVVCVDPNPIYQTYLHKNLTVNGLITNAVIAPVAIGGNVGKTSLQLLKDDWNSATTQSVGDFKKQRKVPYELDERIEVPMTTIDQLAKENDISDVSVLKIDIEGDEEKTYSNMKQVIKQSPKLSLLMEFSPENYKQPEAFFERIQADFAYIYVMPTGRDITRVQSFNALCDITKGTWMMIVASKQNLDKKLP